jgi:hypothetical protein
VIVHQRSGGRPATPVLQPLRHLPATYKVDNGVMEPMLLTRGVGPPSGEVGIAGGTEGLFSRWHTLGLQRALTAETPRAMLCDHVDQIGPEMTESARIPR